MSNPEERWQQRAESHLVGRRIVEARYLSDSELGEFGWHRRPIVLVLDDGNWLLPMRDDEGNDGGALATSYDDLPTIPVISRK